MSRFSYTTEMKNFLKVGFASWRIPELTEKFNNHFGLKKTPGQIKSCLKNNGFTCGRRGGCSKGERITLLTPEQVEFVERRYKEITRHELLDELNRKFGLSLRLTQLVAFIKKHKITSGRTGQYEKGCVSFNAGTKGLMKKNSGSFQQGHRPKNYKPLGHERTDKDGYVLVKVAECNPWNHTTSGWYRHKHVVIWEEVNGSVPNGYCVRFKDGDRRNICLENLILVSRGEHVRLTQMGYGDQPDEIKPVLVGVAKLEQAIHEKRCKTT
ncbi:HNH endonuclease signature motif containing protein [Desulforhopalus singaporensis]|uniref:HNH endonuclease n=1 Tax=Desulforhopalus singaporensis TaxID=91360 RepID=A0A1H0NSE5_9BACT|nr:HNH endonuclease signature motif containing protein [Desulforhopalus singaporensis]SDO95310.1 HNH endonuclease [Desulforhopalus singaporensis]